MIELKLILPDQVYKVQVHNNPDGGEIYREVDGYFVYAPPPSRGGYWPAYLMKAIADKLDELNEEWDQQLKEWDEANEAVKE